MGSPIKGRGKGKTDISIKGENGGLVVWIDWIRPLPPRFSDQRGCQRCYFFFFVVAFFLGLAFLAVVFFAAVFFFVVAMARLPSRFVYNERRVNLYLKNHILPLYGLFCTNALLYIVCQYFFCSCGSPLGSLVPRILEQEVTGRIVYPSSDPTFFHHALSTFFLCPYAFSA